MALDTPKSLRMFLVVAVLLTVFMFLNILTTAHYLHNVASLAGAFKISSSRYFGVGSVGSSGNASSPPVVTNASAANPPPTQAPAAPPASTTTTPKPAPPPAKVEPTDRPENCKDCFIHDFQYLLQNETICKLYDDKQVIDVVVLIFTVHGSEAARKAIRETWASPSKGNTANFRHAFLLGAPPNPEVKAKLEAEAKVHGDIIMESFHDSYNNLTYKTIMGFKWVTKFCAHAKFFMKTDDDMWVNFRALQQLLSIRGKELDNAVGGACMIQAGPIRDPRSKWYASKKSYPQSSYPGFCSGTGYVTTTAVAKKVYEISPSVPFFHLEDVYVALCIRKLGYRLLPLPGFHNYRTRLKPCEMQSNAIITSHQVPTDFLHKAFDEKC